MLRRSIYISSLFAMATCLLVAPDSQACSRQSAGKSTWYRGHIVDDCYKAEFLKTKLAESLAMSGFRLAEESIAVSRTPNFIKAVRGWPNSEFGIGIHEWVTFRAVNHATGQVARGSTWLFSGLALLTRADMTLDPRTQRFVFPEIESPEGRLMAAEGLVWDMRLAITTCVQCIGFDRRRPDVGFYLE